MKNKLIAYAMAALALVLIPRTVAEVEKTPLDTAVTVFEAGKGNPYASIRIPAIINVRDEMLVAFAEGRYANNDQGKNDIIVSLSKDGGRTWSAPTVAAAAKGATFNNPYIMYDSETKQLVLFFQCYPPGVSEQGSVKPSPGWEDPNSLRNFVCFSTDGVTWTEPKDVTATTKHADATMTCSGPNPGVVLTRGEHKGRLVVVFNEAPRFGYWHITAAYSDDHGQTWKLGEKSRSGGDINEISVAETEDGGILVVSRNQNGAGGRYKRVAYSKDGGQTWGDVTPHTELPCPRCQNGLTRYSFADDEKLGNKGRILFSGSSGANTDRVNGIIKMSYDDGRTWPVQKLAIPGPFAYSALCPLESGYFGLLYEVNGNPLRVIKFTRISMDWLTDGADSGK